MRVASVLGFAVLVAAALVVPLPWRVVAAASLVDVAQHVRVEVDPALEANSGQRDGEVRGTYLGTTAAERATFVELFLGAVRPSADITRAPTPGSGPNEQLTASALSGLGIAPGRTDPTRVPVVVTTSDPVSRDSAAAAMYVFDAMAGVDIAGGRTVAVLGFVSPDLTLLCTRGVPDAVAAAVAAGSMVIVVARSCADEAQTAVDSLSAAARIVPANTLYDLVNDLPRR